MVFVAPAPLIRRNMIIKKLKECGVNSPETAKTLAEVGVINPNLFPSVTERLIKRGRIHRTLDGKYYI